MKRLGLIARADNSGLAVQTWELWRHLQPERTLIVLRDHHTRGDCRPERYEGIGSYRVTERYPTQKDVRWLCNEVDVVFSAECFYSNRVYETARRTGTTTVLQANPEMYDRERSHEVVAPTSWRLDLLPEGTEVLPVPVALDRFSEHAEFRPVRTFYHVHSTAMEDRNGTALVLAAAERMGERCRILIRGSGEPWRKMFGRVEVEWLGPFDGPYWQHWPDEIDALVLPRRFGGLCLPFQEAAAQGIPIIMLGSDPYASMTPPECRVPAELLRTVPMKGGQFDVYTCSPGTLAEHMDRLVADGVLAKCGALASWVWAGRNSWELLGPRYEELLR